MKSLFVEYLLRWGFALASNTKLQSIAVSFIPKELQKRVVALALYNYVSNAQYNLTTLEMLYRLPFYVAHEKIPESIDEMATELDSYLGTAFFTRGLTYARSNSIGG